jgi:hypothetical protein
MVPLLAQHRRAAREGWLHPEALVYDHVCPLGNMFGVCTAECGVLAGHPLRLFKRKRKSLMETHHQHPLQIESAHFPGEDNLYAQFSVQHGNDWQV